MSLRMFVTTLECVEKKQGHSAPVAAMNKNFDLLADNGNNNHLEIFIYLDNLLRFSQTCEL